jgi:cytochrome c peroxidase
MRTLPAAGAALATVLVLAACSDETPTAPEAPAFAKVPSMMMMGSAMAEVGDFIFHDTDLSLNNSQSCASCHDEAWGGTGPVEAFNAAGAVYEGSVPGRFGDRKPPSSTYATLSPIFHFDKGLWVGGNFWDGRATGELLGNPSADQALGPFLNRVEQALPDLACVVHRVAMSTYAGKYTDVFGNDIGSITWPANTDVLCGTEGITVPLSTADREKAETEYHSIGLAVAAYEASPEVNAFSSKFDVALRAFTQEERRGRALFNGKALCSRCHTSKGKRPAFTDFTYDNLGVPINPQNPAYLADDTFRDRGLGAFLERIGQSYEDEDGKVKVPTHEEHRSYRRRAQADARYAHANTSAYRAATAAGVQRTLRFPEAAYGLPRADGEEVTTRQITEPAIHRIPGDWRLLDD